METKVLTYLGYFFSSFFLSLAFTPIVKAFALKHGLIAYPRADRWHKHPTALLGGISIYLAAIIPAFFVWSHHKNVIGLLSGATFLFFMGLADDKFHFTPYTKLFAQVIAGCIAIFSGVILGIGVNSIFLIPLTLLWIVGVTNAFNLLDNIDGLATGTAVISSLLLFFSSLIFSNNQLGIFALFLSGAALGFLPYNFNPAKIFMGDSGSMFLGYSLAVVSVAGTGRHVSNLFITIALPVLILSVPIFDTIFVMIARRVQGRRIFEGGRDHTSHHLVTLGLSPRKTVILLYLISIIFGSIALLYSKFNVFVLSIITLLGVIILLYFGFFLSETSIFYSELQKARRNKRNELENKTFLNTIFLHKRRIVEFFLDFLLICVAYYSAYFLRFEGALLEKNLILIRDSLTWIILIKMASFFIFGLYRGVWRYISISDMIAIVKVTSIGSIASILFLTFTFRFKGYSRAVFFIDWLLLLCLLSGTRILFRVLGEFFSGVREQAINVLIFGAGDTGEMAIREIKRNRSLNYKAVGFLDDNPAKKGNSIQGVRVLGNRDNIHDLVERYDIKELIIAIPSLDMADYIEIAAICRECGVPFRKIKGILDREDVIDFGKR